MPKVSIVIVNWNGWKDTIECLESLRHVSYQNYEIFVVDNASFNESLEKIKEWAGQVSMNYLEFDEDELGRDQYIAKKKIFDNQNIQARGFLLIKNKKNYGFAKGNNIATEQIMQEEGSRYVLLLNNDTVVEKNFLTEMVRTFEVDRNVAVVGAKMYYYNYQGKKNIIWFGGGKINWKKYPGYHHIDEFKEDNLQQLEKPREVDWVSGACLMVDRTKVSPLLNETYFFGCEDVDKCLKAKKKGFKTFYVPNAIVWHKVGQSRPKTTKQKIKTDITNFKLLLNNNPVLKRFLFLLYYFFYLMHKFLKKKINYLFQGVFS